MTGRGLQTHGNYAPKGVCEEEVFPPGAGCRLQLSLHTSHRTALLPGKKQSIAGRGGEEKGYVTGPPRLSFPLKSGNPIEKLDIILDLYSPKNKF